jgi:hypothetical protein
VRPLISRTVASCLPLDVWQLSGAKTDGDKDFYANKCATLDRQIDELAYEFYRLTPDEIKLVECAQ